VSGGAGEDHVFHSSATISKTLLTGAVAGEAEEKFTFSGGELSVSCEEVSLRGTTEGAETAQLTLVPGYEGCTSLGGKATVLAGDCAYLLGGETAEGHAQLQLECAEGKALELEVVEAGITMSIAPQSAEAGVHYENSEAEGAEAIALATTARGLEYTCEGALCFLLPNGGEGSDGTYDGEELLEGFADYGTPQEDPRTPSGTKEGERADVWVS
jgi:hypothetical protein